MKIFLSWSGEPSRTVALALRQWLPDVIQSVEPWMSEVDLEAGARWSERIQRELSETRFGIICVTPQNIGEPWLLFEAGALAKTLQDTYVCPYLIGLEPSALPQGPLTQFQAKRTNRSESRELIMTVNQALGKDAVEPARVERGFDRCWPDLEKMFAALPKSEASESVTPQRTAEELLKEILLLTRNIARRQDRSARQKSIELMRLLEGAIALEDSPLRENAEVLATVRQALLLLPERFARFVRLDLLEHRSEEEIRKEFGLSVHEDYLQLKRLSLAALRNSIERLLH